MTQMPPSRAPAAPCCPEFASLSRRSVLAGGLAIGGAATLVGSAVVTAAPAYAAEADAVLVVLSLRGAADGLSLVVPHADPVYYQRGVRDQIAVASENLLAKDAMFGLHPHLAPLLPLWRSGRLAAVHATGLPVPNRSHFAAMEEIEDAAPGSTRRQGWLNRLVGTVPGTSPLQGFALASGVVPTSLYGDQPVMSARDVDSVAVAGDDEWDTEGRRLRSLHTLWDGQRSPLGRAMGSTFSAVKEFAPAQRAADHESAYPGTDLGRAMSEVARIVRGNVGVGVVTVDHGEWDMHSGIGTLEWGSMQYNVKEFAGAVAAFFGDLGGQASKVTLVAVSEFGRRVVENASGGLDHGHGNVMFVAGAGVKGGRYYGSWPGLTATDDADLLVTTDYRSVLSEIVTTRFGASSATVFPGFQPESVGVMTSL